MTIRRQRARPSFTAFDWLEVHRPPAVRRAPAARRLFARSFRLRWYLCTLLLLTLLGTRPAAAYSVLTHQATIDSTWTPYLLPLLEGRYPGATAAELIEAKSYAYGGSILQDMGYYPFGSELFTNLTHYVRSGDFVGNLLAEAHSRNEYAFALGALAHYAADAVGHPTGTNRAQADVYPNLAAQFGDYITYEQAPVQHTQLEFAFDVVQMAAGHYRTAEYQRLIGFEVSKPVLERAFLKTYGLPLGRVIFNVDLAIGSFRFAVRGLIPLASRAAWQIQKSEIRALSPRARRREYVFKQSRLEYEQRYGNAYEDPGTGARVLSYFVRVLPKIGPLKPFAFQLPTPKAQVLFKASFHQTLQRYRELLAGHPYDTTSAPPTLPNANLDTGQLTEAGEYALTNETYGEWLRKLEKDDFDDLTPTIRQNLLAFFDARPQLLTDDQAQEVENRRATQAALRKLRAR